MNCANDFFKCLCKWVLENCSEDLNFVTKRIDNTCINRFQQIISGSPEMMSYSEAIDVLRTVPHERAVDFCHSNFFPHLLFSKIK